MKASEIDYLISCEYCGIVFNKNICNKRISTLTHNILLICPFCKKGLIEDD